METKKELEIKHAKIRELLDKKDLKGIIFASQTNFLWLSGGKLNNVIRNENISLVYLLFTKDKRYLIASNSDGPRVIEEELENLDFEFIKYRWFDKDYTQGLKRIGLKGKMGSDFTNYNFIDVQNEITNIRRNLSDLEIKKYLDFCNEYSKIITDYCLNLKKLTEIEIAASLHDILFRRGVRLSVLLVGSDDRIFKFRHPCFTNKPVEKYVLIATSAERNGIYANVSRSIHFGKIPSELAEKQKAVNYVYSIFFEKAVSGKTLGELYEIGKKAYKDAGFSNEWKNHHQGGILGYKPLEYIIYKGSNTRINNNNIMGFNPTITGVKTEDPVLIQNGTSRITVFDERWPYEEFEIKEKKVRRPMILELI